MTERIPGKIKIYKSKTVQVGTSDTTVYEVTSGRKFYLEGLVLTETGSSAATVDIFDGPSANDVRPIAPVIVDATSTKTISESVLKGAVPFENSVVMKSSSGTTWVTVIGYEE